jgi:8-oxo-dGTP pyrophosphatase MutT (NUDIX family)
MSGPVWPVSVKGVLLREGRALLLRNPRDEWELPDGRLEPMESPEQCLAREIQEECGLAVTVSALLMVEPFEVIPNRHVLMIAYGCDERDYAAPTMSLEHQGFAWMPLSSLKAEAVPDVYARAIRMHFERQERR